MSFIVRPDGSIGFNWTPIAFPTPQPTESTEGAAAIEGTAEIESPKPGKTGLRAHYFKNSVLVGTPITRIDPAIAFDWSQTDPAEGVSRKSFSARWEGKLVPKMTATHRIFVEGDNAIRVWVGGKLIIDRWTKRDGKAERFGLADLRRNVPTDIKVEFANEDGDPRLALSWSGFHVQKELIPSTCLIPALEEPLLAATAIPKKMVAIIVNYSDGSQKTIPLAD